MRVRWRDRAKRARAAAAAALLALSACPAAAQKTSPANPYPLKSDSDPHPGVAVARRQPIQGIDVSRWQGEIDWARVKAAGTRFAFIKATEGGDFLDEKFRRNWAGARAAGVPRSAYHFVNWCRPAADQIRWIKRHIPRDADALPPVLDVEWTHGSSCGRRLARDTTLARIRALLAAMEAHTGKKPVIYTDITFHEDVFEGETDFESHPFWIRSVAAHPSKRYEDRRWEFWQFTTTGRIPGIVGDVDRNAFFGTEQQFRDWAAGRFDIARRKPVKTPQKLAEDKPPPVKMARRETPAPAPRKDVATTASAPRRN